MASELTLIGQRILVVEDDYYLATETASALREAGATVVGPCASESMARQALAHGPVTGVVLDVNLRGGRSFALARELEAAGTPFLFITGYDPEVIPRELETIECLQKPVALARVISRLATALVNREVDGAMGSVGG